MRILRRLLILVLVFGGLFVGGNIVAERVVEDRLGDAVRVAFDLSRTPTVDLDAFPIVLRLVDGTVPAITVTAGETDVEGLTVRALLIRLEGLEVDGGLLSGGELSVVVGRGSAVAEVDQDAVNALIRARGERATIRILPGGGARVRAVRPFLGRDRRIDARGRLVLRGATLRFEPREVTVDGSTPPPGFEAEARRESTVSVELPDLPGGFRIDELRTSRGGLTLRAVVSEKRLVLRR